MAARPALDFRGAACACPAFDIQQFQANFEGRHAMAKAKAETTAKAADMKASGLHRYRSHTCGALRESDMGGVARLSGWVHRVRDHGGVLFIDLRDHYGITQVVADPDSAAFKTAEKVR